MTDITIIVPLGFTVADIARVNPSLSESEALELAQEAHAIIAAVQASYRAFPPGHAELAARVSENMPYAGLLAFEEADLIEMLRRTIVGIWPAGDIAECDLSVWLAVTLGEISDALYLQYLRLYDRINSTKYAEGLGDYPSLTH